MNKFYTEIMYALGGIKFTFFGGLALVAFFITNKKSLKSIASQK
jgi:hypothetical protein